MTDNVRRPPGKTASAEPVTNALTRKWEEQTQSMLEKGGLWVRDATAPPYQDLRPFDVPPETRGFPIYPDLVDHLVNVKEHPDPIVAHVLATCAGYSYSGAETLSVIMARMGLDRNRCHMFSASVDAMFICSTAFLIQSKDGRVAILCYRGTEPLNFISWLTDADVEPERINYQFGDPCASVHGGFYRNVRATRYEVMQTLRRCLEGQSVHTPLDSQPHRTGRLERLYITGHSLGGAMAALMAVMILQEQKYKAIREQLSAVYTFGQPMIGDKHFAEACNKDSFLSKKVIRYTYDSDPVPHLPPWTSGPFMHFGHERHYKIRHMSDVLSSWLRYLGCDYRPRQGTWEDQKRPTRQMKNALGIALGISAFFGRKSQLLRSWRAIYSFEDHLPLHYIAALTPDGKPDEFGD